MILNHVQKRYFVLTLVAVLILDSWFSNDNWMDVRPCYISWADIDDQPGVDLLIWKPSGTDELTASEYISNGDGNIHTLEVPLTRKHDLSAHFLG